MVKSHDARPRTTNAPGFLLTLGLSGAVLVSAGSATAQVRPSAASAEDEAAAQSGSHPVEEGETMWSLSARFLGSGEEWPRLWSYNPEITNPHYIYPGHVVRLREGAAGGPPADAAPGDGRVRSYVLGGPRRTLQTSPPLPLGATLIGEQAFLDKDALKSVSRIVGSVEDHMLLSPSDELYLKLDKGAPPEVGKELAIFVRFTRQEVSPKASRFRVYPAGTEGEIVRIIGRVRVLSFEPKTHIARAVVINARDPIERGFEVADLPGTLTVIAQKPNAKRVDAHIVAATRALGTLGQHQLVFIDAGRDKGVEPGNHFSVVRQGDPWRKQLTLRESLSGAERPDPNPLPGDAFPLESVAELRVLDVRPKSSTALIIKAGLEVYPGEHVEMREGS